MTDHFADELNCGVPCGDCECPPGLWVTPNMADDGYFCREAK